MKKLFILNDKFILPKIIKVLYVLCVIGIIIFGIAGLFATLQRQDYSLAAVALFFIFIMPFIIRIIAEMLIISFKIYEKLKLISKLKAKKLQRENVGE